jgi:UDP-N-acetylmuramoylalanine-D-glutamate ligase
VAAGLSIGADFGKLRGAERIALFGCGASGRRALAALAGAGIRVRWFCDNNAALWGGSVDGVEVISPQELRRTGAAVVIASAGNADAIKAQLADLGVATLN